MKKVICRVKGGLGNQLFCYAAARRLALANNAELILDHTTGFARDRLYRRQYLLDRFSIHARKATAPELFEPLGHIRRGMARRLARLRKFENRHYLEQEGIDFDPRLLEFKVTDWVYVDGLWQGEGYFEDVDQTIRTDLRIDPPLDELNQRALAEIRSRVSVAVHVRWFDSPGTSGSHNASSSYYERAIRLMERRLGSPHYFLFSEDTGSALAMLPLPKGRVTAFTHNRGDETAFADLWLMSHCRHFVIANSTFSWWGAWLANGKETIVVTPNLRVDGKAAWGFKGLIPQRWMTI